MSEMDRRKFILGSAAALAAATRSAEARERELEFLPSPLTPEMLEEQRSEAVRSLTQSVPDDPKMEYLRQYATHLGQESQMYLPSQQELHGVVEKGKIALQELGAQLRVGQYGLFVFADANEKSRTQRLYVLEKTQARSLQFVKAYPVSMSASGFGNRKDSGQTPLGLHTILNGKQGLFGEVVSGLNKHKDIFNHVQYRGEEHWFVKNFGERKPGDADNDVAEVVTDQYLLVGPHTDPSRGIRIHGTNRSGAPQQDGTWTTFLGGRRRSGGCVRMSNVDVRDFALSGYLRMPEDGARRGAQTAGTPVMIFATPAALKTTRLPEDDMDTSHPPRWQPEKEVVKKKRETHVVEKAAERTKTKERPHRAERAPQTQRPAGKLRYGVEHPPRWVPPSEE
jgi:hypothetical protein